MNIKKRILLGAAVGTTVFGSVFGLAAGLNVSNEQHLGSGDAQVTACDNDVSTTYTLDSNGYVEKVNVTNVSDACDEAIVSVRGDVAGTQQAQTYSGDEYVSDNVVEVTLSVPVDPADIDGFTITFLGGGAPNSAQPS